MSSQAYKKCQLPAFQAPIAHWNGRSTFVGSTNQWDHTDKETIAFIQAALAELNKKAGIISLPSRHQDGKEGDICSDVTAIRCFTLHRQLASSPSTAPPCCVLLLSVAGPCKAKLSSCQASLILYVHEEHTVEDHKEGKANCVKTRHKSDKTWFEKLSRQSPWSHERHCKAHQECARLTNQENWSQAQLCQFTENSCSPVLGRDVEQQPLKCRVQNL